MKLVALILGVSGALGLSLRHESSSTQAVFDNCDNNNDGKIDASEIGCVQNLAASVGLSLKQSQIDMVVNALPADYNQFDGILNNLGVWSHQ